MPEQTESHSDIDFLVRNLMATPLFYEVCMLASRLWWDDWMHAQENGGLDGRKIRLFINEKLGMDIPNGTAVEYGKQVLPILRGLEEERISASVMKRITTIDVRPVNISTRVTRGQGKV